MYNRNKVSWFQLDRIFLFLFILGTGVLFGSNHQRILGICLALTTIILGLQNRHQCNQYLRKTPPELLCYTLWALWAGITGIMTPGLHLPFFWFLYKAILQMVVMIWCISLLLRIRMTPNIVFFAMILYSVCQLIAAYFGIQLISDLTQESERITGLTTNPNGFALLLALGAIAATMFWYNRKLPLGIQRVLIIALLCAVGCGIAISGSRKSLVFYAIFLILWAGYVLPTGRNIGRFLFQLASMLIVGVLLQIAIPIIMENTAFGTRWEKLMEQGDGDVRESIRDDVRYRMYMNGFRFLASNPIKGLGLGQYQARLGVVSHSDYMEVLSTTGIVGFILYQSVYLILFRRLIRLIRMTRLETDLYLYRAMLTGLIIILFYGLGGAHMTATAVYSYLAAVSAYTWVKLKEARNVRCNPCNGFQPVMMPRFSHAPGLYEGSVTRNM
jgi:O-antigen ligase